MKKYLILLALSIPIVATVGCSGGGGPASGDDKDLRKQFAKEKFDMKDVPPNQRAMVQGFIDRSKHPPNQNQANQNQSAPNQPATSQSTAGQSGGAG